MDPGGTPFAGRYAAPLLQLRKLDPVRAIMLAVAAIAALCVLSLIVTVVWLSFTRGLPGDPALAYTLGHYQDVFLDTFTYRVLSNTIGFAVITLAVAFALGLPIAWLIERTDFPGKPVVFTLMTAALLIPGFAVALGWLFLLHPRIGLLNQAVVALAGLKEAPFNILTIRGMGMVEGLTLTPLVFIMTSVVLRSMDPALEEAASMSGAKPWRVAYRVTLPVLFPGIMAAAIYAFAISFAAFDVPATLGLTNRIFTFSTYVFSELGPTQGTPQYGEIATLSIIMIAFALVLSWGYLRAQRHAPRYAVVTGKAYRPRILPLRRHKPAAVSLVIGYFLIAQGLPLLTLLWASGLPYLQTPSRAAFARLSLRHFNDLPQDLLVRSAINTVMLMILVPTITLMVSFAISWVVLRSKIRGRGLVDFLAFLPLTIPPIVFSVAALLLALFVLRHVAPIYGTIWILVLAYVIARLSYGTRMINGALIQIISSPRNRRRPAAPVQAA